MPANVDAMLRAAIEAYKAGNKADARALLDKVLEVDEYNENAWMWMSASVETNEEKRTCLENVLVINPKNEKARQGMKSLGYDPDAGSAAPPPSASVFTDTSFAGGADSNASVWDDDTPPTATSSASSTGFRPSNTSSGDLDSWISGMGIGGAPKQPSLAPTHHPFSDLSTDDEDDEPEFEGFDDRLNNMFSADEFDIDEPPARPAASSRTASPSNRATPPAAFSSPSLFDEDDDSSPFDDDLMDGLTDDDMDEFTSLISGDNDDDIFAPPARQSPMSPPNRATSTSSQRAVSPSRERDEDDGEAPDAAKLFAMIPKEVEVASRLPGEDEESPRALLIGIVVLVVLNLAALGYILVG